jgi:8-oxo-dGTP pyrophosphatase MutT (NUDIX family)
MSAGSAPDRIDDETSLRLAPPARLREISQRMRQRSPQIVGLEPGSRAAVAMVLAPEEDDLRVLLIKRAEHPADPWSGHMALPGGRHDAGDGDLAETAIRETAEEVGIDLATHGQLISRLDDLQATARGRNLDMVITPFLFTLDRPHPTVPDRSEVAATLWVPMRVFEEKAYHGEISFERDGMRADYPAFLYEGHKVWGLTYRIIRGFVDALAHGAALGR